MLLRFFLFIASNSIDFINNTLFRQKDQEFLVGLIDIKELILLFIWLAAAPSVSGREFR
jgi:hypothetical protein